MPCFRLLLRPRTHAAEEHKTPLQQHAAVLHGNMIAVDATLWLTLLAVPFLRAFSRPRALFRVLSLRCISLC